MGTEEGIKNWVKWKEAGLKTCKTCAGTALMEVSKGIREEINPRTGVAREVHIRYVRPCEDSKCKLKLICKTCLGTGRQSTEDGKLGFVPGHIKPCTDPDCKVEGKQ
jgi:hypothetical protein